MIRKIFLFNILLIIYSVNAASQGYVKTVDLFQRSDKSVSSGRLEIIQSHSIDTLISRYIIVNKNLQKNAGYFGMHGHRIQIYSSSNRNAREESSKVNAEFISKFPDIRSYSIFAQPGYYKIRAGDFRTKAEAMKTFLLVSREFPDSYLVPDFINFPDLVKK